MELERGAGDLNRAVLRGGLWRAVLVGALALFLGIGLLGVAWVFARPLGLLLAAIILAQAVAPAVHRLTHWLPRAVAIVAVYFAGLLLIGAVAWVVTARLAAQLVEAAERAPSLVERLLEALGPFGRVARETRLPSLLPDFAEAAGTLSELPLVALNAVFETLLVIAVSMYWLNSSRRLVRFWLSLVPSGYRRPTGALLRELGETMGGYVRARVLVALASGAVIYAGLLLIGIEYSLALGLIAALGKLVPLVGAWLAAVPLLAVALLTAAPWQVAAALVAYGATHSIATYLLLPNLTRQQAEIPSVLALVALLAGSTVADFLGLLLAIPLAGAARVLVIRLVVPALQRWAHSV